MIGNDIAQTPPVGGQLRRGVAQKQGAAAAQFMVIMPSLCTTSRDAAKMLASTPGRTGASRRAALA
jgi:hypothetical protein